MDSVSTARLIAELGVLVVIAGVFIFLAYYVIKRMMDKFFDNLPSVTPEPIHPTIEQTPQLDVINRKLYEECKGLLKELRADRAYIVLFHNGDKSQSGLFFQKMSCICEVVSPGIQALSSTFQNIHRASYSFLLDTLKDNNEWLVDNVEDYKEISPFLYSQVMERHVCSTYLRLLKDINGSGTGFVGIDYCALNTQISSDKISDLLETVGHKVSSLVDIRDEVK